MVRGERDPISIPVDDPSGRGEVRRAAVALAAALDFSEADRGRVALVATEAAGNLHKHATGGEVVLRSLSAAEGGGLELLAVDRGPGMADVGKCLRDGFSTAGSPGHGLGAMGRLADRFDLHSAPGVGTAVLVRVCPGGRPGLPVGTVCLPVAGEDECGDAWAATPDAGRLAVLVADGLGHGPAAAAAARAAVECFRAAPRTDPAAVLHRLHEALRPTRGAAAAVAVVDPFAGTLRYAGVGNISGVVIGPDGRRHGLVSHSGTLGREVRKVQAFDHPWPAGGLLVMHSDGLGSQWDLGRYPGLAARDPALVAGVLYRDARRGRDDCTVLAARPGGPA